MKKTLLLALALIAVGCALSEMPSEITYTEFRAQLSAGNVHQVSVKDREIVGEFRAPVIKADQEITRFKLTLPGEMTDGLIDDLEAADVIIDARTSQPSWGQLLLSALPWLLLMMVLLVPIIGLGVLVYVLYSNRKRKGGRMVPALVNEVDA